MDLSYNEKIVLKAIGEKEINAVELADMTGLKVETVVHAASILAEKGLADLKEEVKSWFELTWEGKKYAVEGLPERVIHDKLPAEGMSLNDVKKEFPPQLVNIAIGWLRQKSWAKFEKKDGDTILIPLDAPQSKDEKLLECLSHEKFDGDLSEYKKELKDLLKRNLIEEKEKKERIIVITSEGLKLKEAGIEITEEIGQLTPEMIMTGAYAGKSFRKFDVDKPVQMEYGGRKHILRMGMDKVKRTLIEMGFKEMEGPMVDAEFYVNDLLFMPQDHPARTHWDQFNLKFPQYINYLPEDLIKKVAQIHLDGGDTGSLGWNYQWDEMIAKKLVLRGHTTSVTARYLAKYKTPPQKFFSVEKVFRNDTIDATHLLEFFQIEGWIMDHNLNIKELMGTFKEFYARMGITVLKFKPTYNPYTEPSLEIYGRHPRTNRWIEVGNSGMFREEMLAPYGIDCDVVAWGLALERLMMILYGYEDIRDLHGPLCDINFLRSVPVIWRQ
ncbi:phenylalanine--tRNA ligase subunit alpha [Methanocella sp. CWC-04]|uniref:Phenylalanine--tRNA ligase alpha subunit n=1 Tax=Methanooceanicella nereidis TaxID=2052831 RepID=A0AAP2RCX4_9EURY|nr:phenylalanine--tRNA ligase subunit alpha [Methanocella sp. CWC-04]MCD1295013.1 phenylalanine--tRNA ligase subunit alpha [Methanocella sp. CWC-04]